jgi:hypothetical protein
MGRFGSRGSGVDSFSRFCTTWGCHLGRDLGMNSRVRRPWFLASNHRRLSESFGSFAEVFGVGMRAGSGSSGKPRKWCRMGGLSYKPGVCEESHHLQSMRLPLGNPRLIYDVPVTCRCRRRYDRRGQDKHFKWLMVGAAGFEPATSTV